MFDRRRRMRRATGILPANDHIASSAQLPHIAAQIEIGIFEFYRVADSESAAVVVAHDVLRIRRVIGASAHFLKRVQGRMLT